MSQPVLPFDPAVLAALKQMVLAQAPPNRVMTVAEVEQAVFDLVRSLGAHLTQDLVAAQLAAAEKRGTGRGAAGRTCAGSGTDHAPC